MTYVKQKCPKFKKGDDFIRYLTKFEFFCDLNKIKKDDLGLTLIAQMEGLAFDMAMKIPKQDWANYKRVCNTLNEYFGPVAGEWNDMHQLNTRIQTSKETAIEYIDELERLADRAGFNEEQKPVKVIEIFLKNAADEDVKKVVIKHQIKSVKAHENPWETLKKIKAAIKTSI